MYKFSPLSARSVRGFASAIFPTLALLHRSCDHNITKYFLPGGKVVAVAARNIAKGEEVTENYYPHFAYMKR